MSEQNPDNLTPEQVGENPAEKFLQEMLRTGEATYDNPDPLHAAEVGTPRTDREPQVWVRSKLRTSFSAVSADFARTLERELTASKQVANNAWETAGILKQIMDTTRAKMKEAAKDFEVAFRTVRQENEMFSGQVKELRERLAKAEAGRADANKPTRLLGEEVAHLRADNTRLRSSLTLAVEALENYGKHFNYCRVSLGIGDCNCGYTAALTRETEGSGT